MPAQYWMAGNPPFHTADGTAVTASATLTNATPTPEVLVPAPWWNEFAGKRLEVQMWGVYTTTATQGTITFGLYSGTSGQAIGSAAALAVSSAVTWVASQTNRVWRMEGNLSVRTVGTSGAAVAVLEASNLSATATDMAATAAGSTVTVDTTVSRYLALGVTLSAASQSFTCRYFGVRLVN